MIRFIRSTDVHVYVLHMCMYMSCLVCRRYFKLALSYSALLYRSIAFTGDRCRAVICCRPSGCISGWIKGCLNANGTAVSRQLIRESSRSHLLSVSGSRGPVFRKYLLNEQIDHDETFTQEVLVCGLIFHIILL